MHIFPHTFWWLDDKTLHYSLLRLTVKNIAGLLVIMQTAVKCLCDFLQFVKIATHLAVFQEVKL